MRVRTLLASSLVVLGLLAGPGSLRPAQGQILSGLKKAAKSAAEREAESQMARLIREGIRCAVDDPRCADQARADGKEVIYTDADGEIITDEDGAPITDREAAAEAVGVDPSAPERPGEGVWANYDFVPGETVLFAEDYGEDKVGDFPRRLEFVRGNWEIVEWEGRRLLRNTGPRASAFEIELPRALPERFTIEVDAYFTHANHQVIVSTTPPPEGKDWGSLEGNFFRIGRAQGTGVDTRARGGVSATNRTDQVGERLTPIRIMVDGSYAKVYVGERRVANVPNAELPRTSKIWVENVYAASEENPVYLGRIRVAEGGVDLYDKLAESGRVATHGILFSVNSATIRPESTPTLEEMGTMLQQHPDLRLRIEGHTDATGDDASNLELSRRRAEAVRDFLVESWDVDPGRLEVEGLGETKPIDDNDTPEGRQNNRRVELVKLGG